MFSREHASARVRAVLSRRFVEYYFYWNTEINMINWRALENVPILLYILAAKTLLLCLAFAGAKMYQQKKAEAALKQQLELKRKLIRETQELLDNKKDD